MRVKEFIKDVLIGEIKRIQQDHGHHYLSFSLISQGIEFLGACTDSFDFQESGKSRGRFNDALSDLFPSEYHPFVKRRGEQFDLYSNLRCGLLHIVVPGSDLELIQESEIQDYGRHLEIKNLRNKNRLILVSQNFMADFEEAGNKVIRLIDGNLIIHRKVYGEILSTTP